VAGLVARITGRPSSGMATSSVLDQELNLSSLDRVELMGELEERFQVDLSDVKFSDATTIGQVEELIRNPPKAAAEIRYPRWPQNWLITAIRIGVYYLLVWPATYLLAAPRIRGRENLRGLSGPVLVVSNHVTYVDIGWILAALPARFRHRLATGMRAERIAIMLRPPPEMGLLERLSERFSYFLVFALFNVFPLPRESGFRRSFAFAGDLADRAWNALIFPEGITTPDGLLHPFRAGIGLLAKQLKLPVVPIRLDGLFDMKIENRIAHWPGKVRVSIGAPMQFSSNVDANEIARKLERTVESLHWPGDKQEGKRES
jgi:long-chain acyl-CoA synthetase